MATTPKGIKYPLSSDVVKSSASPSALADDFKELADSTDAAIAGGVIEAINDATTKYGGLPSRVTAVESKNAAQDLRLNGVEAVNTAQGTRLTNVENRNTQQDERLAEAETQLGGLTSAIRTRGTLAAGDLFALKTYNDNGIYTLDGSVIYTNKPFTGSGSLTVANDYQGVGTLFAQRDITGELWITINTTASGGSFVSWAQIPNTRGKQLTTEHLDTIITPGDYWVRTNEEATVALGYPFTAYGDLKVRSESTNDANVTQTYTPSQRWGNGFAIRSRYNEVWGDWKYFTSVDQQARGTQITTENLDDIIVPGDYWQRLNVEATPERNYPFEAYGDLKVTSQSTNDANVTQMYVPSQRYGFGFAIRSRYNTVWEGWKFFTPSGGADSSSEAGGGSGFKITPLALTLGTTGVDAPVSRHVRIPMNFAAPIPRFRVHIRNYNPRLGTVRTGAVTFTGLWIGEHAGNGAFKSTPTQLRGGFATPENGDEWVSAWFNKPIGSGTDYLLSYGYTAPAAPVGLVGGSWGSATLADANAVAPTVSVAGITGFDIWLEAETPATTSVVGVLGDSLSAGTGSSLPVHDSVISQYARKIGGLPYHLAAHGDSMNGMITVNPNKVTRWANLAKPDSIIWAVGSNDIAEGVNLATLQGRFAKLQDVVSPITSALYLADIMPRTSWAPGSVQETTRRAYNAWMRSNLPGGARDIFGFAASISADDENIDPAYNSGDNTHLNTLGYTRNMEAIVRPITAPSPVTMTRCVRLEAGKWVWDTVAGTHYVIPDHTGALIVRATAVPVPNPTIPEFNW